MYIIWNEKNVSLSYLHHVVPYFNLMPIYMAINVHHICNSVNRAQQVMQL